MFRGLLLLLTLHIALAAGAQDMSTLIKKVKAKLDQVTDYVADGKMKTDVSFIKAPIGKIKVYFKKPNLFRLKKEGGISLLPKGGVSVNMNSIITTNDFMALSAGESKIGNTPVKIVKLLPNNENSEIVLTTMYIDEANLLVRKAITTTKENGTYEMEMDYGNYAGYGLPDKVIFSFNTKDYKLPKGITLEFDDAEKQATKAEQFKNKKGRIEISYSNYQINKGISDVLFVR